MSIDVRTPKIGKAYSCGDTYEEKYGAWVQACHEAAMNTLRDRYAHALQEGNLKVLDVGVGTGLSLLEYPEGVDVTGIDTSDDMLQKAEEKIAKPKNSVTLCIADATALPFADNEFDVAMALEVINTIPKFQKAIAEIIRVTRGMIIVTNTFLEDTRFGRLLDNTFCRSLASYFTKRHGFHMQFQKSDLLKIPNLEVVKDRLLEMENDKRTKTSKLFGAFPRMIVLRKTG